MMLTRMHSFNHSRISKCSLHYFVVSVSTALAQNVMAAFAIATYVPWQVMSFVSMIYEKFQWQILSSGSILRYRWVWTLFYRKRQFIWHIITLKLWGLGLPARHIKCCISLNNQVLPLSTLYLRVKYQISTTNTSKTVQ